MVMLICPVLLREFQRRSEILELNHVIFYVFLVHFLWIFVNKKMWKNYVS